MCIVFLDVDPGREWPIVVAAVRDEFADRPWSPPAAHWPDLPDVVGPRDDTAGGTWLAVDERSPALALVVNRPLTPAPARGRRSRGELPLDCTPRPDACTAPAGASAVRRLPPAPRDRRTGRRVDVGRAPGRAARGCAGPARARSLRSRPRRQPTGRVLGSRVRAGRCGARGLAGVARPAGRRGGPTRGRAGAAPTARDRRPHLRIRRREPRRSLPRSCPSRLLGRTS